VYDNAVRREHVLSDWRFALGFPTTRREFINALARGEFCLLPPPFTAFAGYEQAIIEPFEAVIVPFERGGLRILRYPTSRQYAALLRGTTPTVLLTHGNPRGELEFRDGMVSCTDVARLVNPAFRGIADVGACDAVAILPALKARAPRCMVKTTDDKLS
jgi:hypothetical protein